MPCIHESEIGTDSDLKEFVIFNSVILRFTYSVIGSRAALGPELNLFISSFHASTKIRTTTFPLRASESGENDFKSLVKGEKFITIFAC